MPRQLPWKNNGGGSRTAVKQPPRLAKTLRILNDIDEDFFDGTVLASSSKGKDKAKMASDSDDSLPDLSVEPSTPQRKRTETTSVEERAISSSPPLLADCAFPHSEPMCKGVSKFDLRDDEWMMVEDELLETAKSFTRHLHIAEYERLKESIEVKKRQAGIARPVVAGAKRSVEGAIQERTRFQHNKQQEAIRDVFAAQKKNKVEGDRASCRPKRSISSSKMANPLPTIHKSQDIDSDDLDAPLAPKPKIAASTPMMATKPTTPLPISKATTSSFAKPSLSAAPAPAPARLHARTSKMTPFDMLDQYVPPKFDSKPHTTTALRDTQMSASNKSRSQSASSNHSSPRISSATRPQRSLDLLGDWGSRRDTGRISEDVADRIAKRKTRMAKESDMRGKRSAVNLDDIPTFLF